MLLYNMNGCLYLITPDTSIEEIKARDKRKQIWNKRLINLNKINLHKFLKNIISEKQYRRNAIRLMKCKNLLIEEQK